MNKFFIASACLLAFSSVGHAADIGGDLINFTYYYPSAAEIDHDDGEKIVTAQGAIFHESPDIYDAVYNFTVTAKEITITAPYGVNVGTSAYFGFTFTNLSKIFPAQYSLISSTFANLPTGEFYSTAGNKFTINMAGSRSPGGGALVFALPSPVPEPESYAMLLAGMGLMGAIARRRQRRQQITA
jgi:hypothetical protein